jgi:hypothetical protein
VDKVVWVKEKLSFDLLDRKLIFFSINKRFANLPKSFFFCDLHASSSPNLFFQIDWPNVNTVQRSISPTFYVCLFSMLVLSAPFWQLCRSFSLVTFGFVIFCPKILYEKRARKMLMKLMAEVNFTQYFACIFLSI